MCVCVVGCGECASACELGGADRHLNTHDKWRSQAQPLVRVRAARATTIQTAATLKKAHPHIRLTVHEVVPRAGEEGVEVAGPPARHLLQRDDGPLRRLSAELRQHLVEPRALNQMDGRVQLGCRWWIRDHFGSIEVDSINT